MARHDNNNSDNNSDRDNDNTNDNTNDNNHIVWGSERWGQRDEGRGLWRRCVVSSRYVFFFFDSLHISNLFIGLSSILLPTIYLSHQPWHPYSDIQSWKFMWHNVVPILLLSPSPQIPLTLLISLLWFNLPPGRYSFFTHHHPHVTSPTYPWCITFSCTNPENSRKISGGASCQFEITKIKYRRC